MPRKFKPKDLVSWKGFSGSTVEGEIQSEAYSGNVYRILTKSSGNLVHVGEKSLTLLEKSIEEETPFDTPLVDTNGHLLEIGDNFIHGSKARRIIGFSPNSIKCVAINSTGAQPRIHYLEKHLVASGQIRKIFFGETKGLPPEDLQKIVKPLGDRIIDLERELEEARDVHGEIQEELEIAQEEATRWEESYDEKSGELEDLRIEYQEMDIAFDENICEKDTLEETVGYLEATVEDLNNQIENLKKEIDKDD
jgi:hypothetical protein